MPEVGRTLGPAPRIPVSLLGQGLLWEGPPPAAGLPGLQPEWDFKATV